MDTGPAKWAVRAQGQAVGEDRLQKLGTRTGSELSQHGDALGEEGLAWWRGNYPGTYKK